MKDGYNARKKRNRRALRTGSVLRGMFGKRRRKPCAYCGKMLTIGDATFDHVVLLSRGGYDKRKNGVIACAACNRRKGRMTAEAFRNLLKAEAMK